jgi:hypothetical protein
MDGMHNIDHWVVVSRRSHCFRHPYKYVLKTVYQQFFPLFALLENSEHVVGATVLGHRKELYLEKLFAAMLLGAPRVRALINDRVNNFRSAPPAVSDDDRRRRECFLTLLRGMDVLLNFYLPAVFRLGYHARCCTWDGRARNTATSALNVMEQSCVLLVHLLHDSAAKNEYVRTLSVAIVSWQRWHSTLPAVCYAEESCEALLSRMGNRLETYRTMTGFDAAFDLFLTLPAPSQKEKCTRGMLKQGLVDVFVARMRKVLFSDGSLPFAAALASTQKKTAFEAAFPEGFVLPDALPGTGQAAAMEKVLYSALRVLTGKRVAAPEVQQFFDSSVRRCTPEDLEEYDLGLQSIAEALRQRGKSRVPRSKPQPNAAGTRTGPAPPKRPKPSATLSQPLPQQPAPASPPPRTSASQVCPVYPQCHQCSNHARFQVIMDEYPRAL